MTQTAPRAEAEPAADSPSAGVHAGWGWLCGGIGGVAGIAVADLTAFVIAPAGSPVAAVGATIIDLLPAGLVNWARKRSAPRTNPCCW